MRLSISRMMALSAAAMPLVSAHTQVSINEGMDINIKSSIDPDGNLVMSTVTSKYTSYILFINDNKVKSSFIGSPVFTTNHAGSTIVKVVPVKEIPKDGLPTPTEATDGSNGDATPTSTPKPTAAPTATSKPTGSSTPTETPATSSKKVNAALIGGAVGGGVAGLAIIGVLIWFFYRRHKRQRQIEEHQKEEMQLLAMELGGSFNPEKGRSNSVHNDNAFSDAASATEELASRYTRTANSLANNHPSLQESFSNNAYHINVGTELTMDSQGRHGLPDGSPLVQDCILPQRNLKAADNYIELEWFPLISQNTKMEPHAGPNYVEDRGLSNIATFIKSSSNQKNMSAISGLRK